MINIYIVPTKFCASSCGQTKGASINQNGLKNSQNDFKIKKIKLEYIKSNMKYNLSDEIQRKCYDSKEIT